MRRITDSIDGDASRRGIVTTTWSPGHPHSLGKRGAIPGRVHQDTQADGRVEASDPVNQARAQRPSRIDLPLRVGRHAARPRPSISPTVHAGEPGTPVRAAAMRRASLCGADIEKTFGFGARPDKLEGHASQGRGTSSPIGRRPAGIKRRRGFSGRRRSCSCVVVTRTSLHDRAGRAPVTSAHRKPWVRVRFEIGL
jgi:hypothetical protein